MGELAMKRRVSLVIPTQLHDVIFNHLFPGDGDEHGLVIAAGIHYCGDNLRLLVREVFPAQDGMDYVAGKHGYRMLTAEFVYSKIRYCREQKLAYLAVHNHSGKDSVAFSPDDMASHERGYPALLDIGQGIPVGAVVCAEWAIAGDIWHPDGTRLPISETRVIGANIARHYASRPVSSGSAPDVGYDRQIRMIGDVGQKLLRQAKVAVIGLGGAGSILAEYLARLGVGHLVLIDPERIDPTNLSRVVGSTRWDARMPFSVCGIPAIECIAKRLAARKTVIARRVVKKANPKARAEVHSIDFATDAAAELILDTDFIFLAADSMRARLVFNAIVQQFYIPGVQIGSKITRNETQLENAFSVTRWVTPGQNCLWCSGLISPHLLALEAKSASDRADQGYGSMSPNPSVITLNAIAAAQAVNDFLMSYLGLHDSAVAAKPRRFNHIARRVIDEEYPPEVSCPECGHAATSRFGRGADRMLPTSRS